MKIEVIDKKNFVFRINNWEYTYIKPHSLMKGFGEFIEGKVKGSTLGWHIEGGWLSFNQMKEALIEKQKSHIAR